MFIIYYILLKLFIHGSKVIHPYAYFIILFSTKADVWELHPPPGLPQGNVGTCRSAVLCAIRSCKLTFGSIRKSRKWTDMVKSGAFLVKYGQMMSNAKSSQAKQLPTSNTNG